jgi:hypothetical protein
MNEKKYGKKWLWHNLRYYPRICPQWLRKTMQYPRVVSVKAEIQTRHLMNTSQYCHCLSPLVQLAWWICPTVGMRGGVWRESSVIQWDGVAWLGRRFGGRCETRLYTVWIHLHNWRSYGSVLTVVWLASWCRDAECRCLLGPVHK